MATTREFRRFLFNIAKDITQAESDTLVYIIDLPVAFNGKSPLTVLAQMESQELFSANKPEGLTDVLKEINRMDLAKRAKDYAKEHAKSAKRKKNCQAEEAPFDEHLHISLKANFEVTLIQTKILVEQLKRLRDTVCEVQQLKRAEEKLSEAEDAAERVQKSLQHAAGLSYVYNWGSEEAPSDEETLPPATPGQNARTTTCKGTMPVKPFLPPTQRSSRVTKEIDEGIYEQPYECLAENSSEDLYYSTVTASQLVTGYKVHSRGCPPPTAKKPSSKAATIYGQQQQRKQPMMPPSKSAIPSPTRSHAQRQKPQPTEIDKHSNPTHSQSEESYEYTSMSDFTGGSDYTASTSTGDSGFSEASQFLRRPLVRRPQASNATTGSYYKSLVKQSAVDYYTTLAADRIEDEIYGEVHAEEEGLYVNVPTRK